MIINYRTYHQRAFENPESVTNRARVFLIGFHIPESAHLRLSKEQSSDIIWLGLAQRQSGVVYGPARCCYQLSSEKCIQQKRNKLLCVGSNPTSRPYHITTTSIRQYLPELAMSDLTTSDLEITSISTGTPVADHLSVNTAGEVLSGEETLVCERPMNSGGSF